MSFFSHQRRQWLSLIGLTGISASFPVLADKKDELREGYDYLVVKPAQPTDAAGKIEVVEFFWYGCPHCFDFDPQLEAWLKKLPADVAFRRIHVAFRDDFVPHQRLFYTLEALGKLPELHKKAFEAFHVQRLPMNNADQIAQWASQQGLDKKTFLDMYNSFSINSKCAAAKQASDNWKIRGVPTLGIQGKYLTSASIAGGRHERALEVASQLIDDIRKKRK
ncbi:thiol:disulfide interchange protein DsbA/DsbL [Parvibium lacunae]|uniref:Thiol:disulfide interchange protein n=1 Tax=Parvibium lacunae TaxID=1888893 RepID=A0A368L198_9BURK|nr:thiol:disulfide interchange protein DsbA/DsbL [Parvibium lacunae]RCS57094.1 thiol:disulfide interchange protein DsbA/DsbL [Parvibium lacunae]